MEVKALLTVACAALALPLAAQRQGPLPPPPPGAVASSGASGDPANTNTARLRDVFSHITNEPLRHCLRSRSSRNSQNTRRSFRKERDNYTYTQIFAFQELDEDGRPDGEYRLKPRRHSLYASGEAFTKRSSMLLRRLSAALPCPSKISMTLKRCGRSC